MQVSIAESYKHDVQTAVGLINVRVVHAVVTEKDAPHLISYPPVDRASPL
jgi:hypothetical protein